MILRFSILYKIYFTYLQFIDLIISQNDIGLYTYQYTELIKIFIKNIHNFLFNPTTKSNSVGSMNFPFF